MINTHLKALVLLTLAGISNTHAASLMFDLNTNYGLGNSGGDVFVTVTDAASVGDVHLNISNFTLGFLNEIYFNYSPNQNIENGVISNFVATNGVVGLPSVQYNGTQGFAIIFDFPNTPGPNFTTGEAVSFDLSADADLTVNGFNVRGQGPVGDDYYMAAHINALEGGADGGAKIGDIDGGASFVNAPISLPQPGTAWLVGLGLFGLVSLRMGWSRIDVIVR